MNMLADAGTITLIVGLVIAFIILAVFFTFVPVALWISALAKEV